MPPSAWPAAGSDVVFYYHDLDAACTFYTEALGFKTVMDGQSIGRGVHLQLASTSFLTLVDGSPGKGSRQSADSPKATAIALLTNDLEAWDEHTASLGLTYMNGKRLKRSPAGSAHDGFVVLDPEGYKLEFEQFLPHPENEVLHPILSALPALPAQLEGPAKGLIATVSWLYYRDPAGAKAFHETELGLPLVCSQPTVAEIYQTSPSGFFGAVNEKNGMSDWASPAAVMLSFVTTNIEQSLAALPLAATPGGEPAALTIDKSDGRFSAAVGFDVEE
eukprot:SAG22_NODE_5085_length_1090_cov_1.136226_1_plen_276_part_00